MGPEFFEGQYYFLYLNWTKNLAKEEKLGLKAESALIFGWYQSRRRRSRIFFSASYLFGKEYCYLLWT